MTVQEKIAIPSVIPDEDMLPSRPGWIFVLFVACAAAGVGFLVFWPHAS